MEWWNDKTFREGNSWPFNNNKISNYIENLIYFNPACSSSFVLDLYFYFILLNRGLEIGKLIYGHFRVQDLLLVIFCGKLEPYMRKI